MKHAGGRRFKWLFIFIHCNPNNMLKLIKGKYSLKWISQGRQTRPAKEEGSLPFSGGQIEYENKLTFVHNLKLIAEPCRIDKTWLNEVIDV